VPCRTVSRPPRCFSRQSLQLSRVPKFPLRSQTSREKSPPPTQVCAHACVRIPTPLVVSEAASGLLKFHQRETIKGEDLLRSGPERESALQEVEQALITITPLAEAAALELTKVETAAREFMVTATADINAAYRAKRLEYRDTAKARQSALGDLASAAIGGDTTARQLLLDAVAGVPPLNGIPGVAPTRARSGANAPPLRFTSKFIRPTPRAGPSLTARPYPFTLDAAFWSPRPSSRRPGSRAKSSCRCIFRR
jgi:hypothetical protein